MEKKKECMKAFNIRMPKELWIFLKTYALHNDKRMNDVLVESIEKLQKKYEKKVDAQI